MRKYIVKSTISFGSHTMIDALAMKLGIHFDNYLGKEYSLLIV
jgi:hypothetical protein